MSHRRSERYFVNPYQDYQNQEVTIEEDKIRQLIDVYVTKIVNSINLEDLKLYSHGDLYVGTSGIAFMFLKLHQANVYCSANETALQNAQKFINHAKNFISRKSAEDSVSFLCGNAGIFAVSSIINKECSNQEKLQEDLNSFLTGFPPSLNQQVNKYGSDEILFGRAGYLSGIHWLNQNLPSEMKISADLITKICDVMIECGVQYSRQNSLKIPMMWECYGDKYLGAAHGICAILHMMLESSLFGTNLSKLNEKQKIVKDTIDTLLAMQSKDGNFPTVLEDEQKSEHELVHWCHGAPGVVYLFAKAFLVFKDHRYLFACLKSGELIWSKGLLRKGPGICHGVAGNGYVFLLLFRLTGDVKHLYRASKFADFLTEEIFIREAKTPDKPLSLYEGLAGTICYLIDLLQPEKASFPFMNVFDN